MSIISEVNRIKDNISNAYDTIEDKGGTLPASKVSANLKSAIESIPSTGKDESYTMRGIYAKLPNGYTRCNYIRSINGSSNIVTDFTIKADHVVEYIASVSDETYIGSGPWKGNMTNDWRIFCAKHLNVDTPYCRICINSDAALGSEATNYHNVYINRDITDEKFLFRFRISSSGNSNVEIYSGDNLDNKLDKVIRDTVGTKLSASIGHYYMLGPNSGNRDTFGPETSSTYYFTVYAFRVYNYYTGKYLHNLIPCRNSAGVAGLYDIIGRNTYGAYPSLQKFYTSTTSVPFTAG